jgi:hypothetical protein
VSDPVYNIGRPGIAEHKRAQIREAYVAGGIGMRALAKRFHVSLGTVQAALRPPADAAT